MTADRRCENCDYTEGWEEGFKAAQAPAEAHGLNDLRRDLIADTREVFDASGSETPQAVRDVIEYVDSWLQVQVGRAADRSKAQPKHTADRDTAISVWKKHCRPWMETLGNYPPKPVIDAMLEFAEAQAPAPVHGDGVLRALRAAEASLTEMQRDGRAWPVDVRALEFVRAAIASPAPAPAALLLAARKALEAWSKDVGSDETILAMKALYAAAQAPAVGADDAKDAARYRWLRSAQNVTVMYREALPFPKSHIQGNPVWMTRYEGGSGESLDATVDAAMNSVVPVQGSGL